LEHCHALTDGTDRDKPEGPGHLWARSLAADSSAALARLDGRARNGPIGAEHATIARLRLQALAAALAIIKEQAGVFRHPFEGLLAAFRTGDGRLLDHAGVFRATAPPCEMIVVAG
jgi:hypothetical protein